MKRTLTTVFLGLLLATPAWAGDFEGKEAWKRGDYVTALRELKPMAERGDAAAQYNPSVMDTNGRGVPQNYLEGYKWYNLAASWGNKLAVAARGALAAHMTPADLSEAQRLSREWLAAFGRGVEK